MEVLGAQETIDRITGLPGVFGVIIANKEGTPVQSSMDNTTTVTHIAHFSVLEHMANSVVRDVDPNDALVVLRIRSTRFEVLIKPISNSVVCVVQRITKSSKIWTKPVQ